MGKWGFGKLLKLCLKCEKEFWCRRDRSGKFCSKSCASKSKVQKSYKITVKCCNCNEEYEVKRYRKNITKFCSKKCLSIVRGLKMQKENHPNWKGGISERSFIDRKLIEKRKKEIDKCEKCNSQNNLEGHHIDGFKNNSENIQILCSECHAKEHPKLQNFIRKKYDRKMDTKNRNEKRRTT